MRDRIPERVAPAISLLLGLTLLVPGVSEATVEVDGIFGLYPVAEQTCLAVQIDLTSGQALAGLGWYHNDGLAPFPQLLLMEGQPGCPPDLEETALILEKITGESLAWGQVSLVDPVVSSTNTIFAVFVFPDGQEMESEGIGGGPGIGYWQQEGGLPTYLSPEGDEWVRFNPEFAVAVEPALVSLKGPATVLSSLKGRHREDESQLSSAAEVTGARLLPPSPNPFNPSVQIRFTLEESSPVALVVYNVRGERIRALVSRTMPSGEHLVVWRGDDDRGHMVASGVYYVVLEAGGQSFRQRLSLVR
jgi:hypothetical protein